MPSISLDRDTADRMLGGDVRSADAPPGYERLCELFDALRDASGELEGFGIAPAERTPARPKRLGLARRVRRSTVAFAVALSLTGGAAFAAGLPQTASRTASDVLDRLGVSVPGWDRQSPPPPKSTTFTSSPGKDGPTSRTTTSKGEKKGAKNSTAPGAGKRRADGHPGRGYGRGGRHGGNPPGHAEEKPGIRNHGHAGKHGTGPKVKAHPAGSRKHTSPGGGKRRPPAPKQR
jgi:hypothetical protein